LAEDGGRTPAFLYRHYLYRRVIRPLAKSPFLEVGAGRGDLAVWLAAQGASGVVLEPSPYAVVATADRLKPYSAVAVRQDDLAAFRTAAPFRLITMMEVLEHIADDDEALRHAAALLAPGGHLVLSVPARMKYWGWRDRTKGHRRRYERAALAASIMEAGLTLRLLWSWGYPFLNIFRGLDRRREGGTPAAPEATARSGVEDDVAAVPAGVLSSPLIAALPFALMDLFLTTDWGVGYVALARREGGGVGE
jgi:SAM-dependent methyltransferase